MNDFIMKKSVFVLLLSLVCAQMWAENISFRFSAGTINNASLKSKMEKNISNLLTEIQTAGTANRSLDLSSIDMEAPAKEHLQNLWKLLPFICEEEMNVSKCLNDFQGYQARNIKIIMKPQDDSYTQSVYRELTVSLNRTGVITGVRPALELQEDVEKVMSNGMDVDDIVRRREILKWVEDFRNYYNERNINSLIQIYSDDALIITGSMVYQRKAGDFGNQLTSNVKYTVQSKNEYIEKMKRIFKNNKYIDVKFDKISVVRHGAKPNIYGVTLCQSWRTSTYSDKGWLFLLWDFTDPDKPQIHVRTWQPEQVVAEHGVFTLNDFFIP
jgi:hypothetical protein